jgi:hypothetical protein
VDLPPGRYAFDAKARDAAGNMDSSSAFQPFVVQ